MTTDLLLLVMLLATVALAYRLYRRPVSQDALIEAEEDEALGIPSQPSRWNYFPRLARQAGFESGSLVFTFWLLKIAVAVLLPLLAIEVWGRWAAFPPVVYLVLLVLVGFFAPDLWLLSRRNKRQRQIRHALSYFLDLLVSLLHSGLGLEEAFRRSAREGLRPNQPLARELSLVQRELDAGRDRGEAFLSVAERTGVAEFRAVAEALRLGLRVGNSVRATLMNQANVLRNQRREEARRQISLAPLKTLLPVLMCGLPMFLVLVVFPALVEVFDIFRELSTVF